MTILRSLPFSLCQPGPKEVDGVGNYYLQVFPHLTSQAAVLTIYLLDSHGQIPSKVKDPDYGWITQRQIDWFQNTSQELRKEREELHPQYPHMSLAFMHIPLPEYADSSLVIRAGRRREPTEGPSFNSHFYDALSKESVTAVGCGHDHVNDFCAKGPQRQELFDRDSGSHAPASDPWLCHGGCSGFGGYCSYGGKRYHRRARIWELDTGAGILKTWTRVEYSRDRNDEMILAKYGEAYAPMKEDAMGPAV
jgi:hypothetical protein